jgi:hypothetical protein
MPGTGQRSCYLQLKPLSDVFNEKSCSVENIEVPEITRTEVIEVFRTNDKAPQKFRTQDHRDIVTFRITYNPYNNDAGKALIPAAKKIVDSVLTADYTPSVAVITLLRNNEEERTITINDCIITKASVIIDIKDYIHIIFEISGLYAGEY